MTSTAIEPWYSSDTVGMRTARPTEALSTQSGVTCQASAAFGDTWVSFRSAKVSVLVAFEIAPSSACQRSRARRASRASRGEMPAVLRIHALQLRLAAKRREAVGGGAADPVARCPIPASAIR